MNTEDIDKIIAEALEKDKEGGKGRKRRDPIFVARKTINTVFVIGAVAAIIAYFACPDPAVFKIIGFSALGLKVIEFFLRFMF